MPPGPTGTGKLIEALLPGLIDLGYTVFFPEPGRSFTENEKQVLLSIFDSKVVLFHPQSIGFDVSQRIIAQNDIGYFVLDNSFFCLKSYNYRGGPNECLDCLDAISNYHQSCRPFPAPVSIQENHSWLAFLKETCQRIEFFCQNYQQASLVRSHFGAQTRIRVVGMRTSEFDEDDQTPEHQTPNFDVVFHGSTALAKGWHYALELALYSPQFSFLFPFDFREIQALIPNLAVPDHITFQAMAWNTGLKLQVQRSRLVLCPSLWSAPIEGALLKSLYFNGNVGVVNTRYGFHCEIAHSLIHRLDPVPQKATETLTQIIGSTQDRRTAAKDWVKQHLAHTSILANFAEFGGQK